MINTTEFNLKLSNVITLSFYSFKKHKAAHLVLNPQSQLVHSDPEEKSVGTTWLPHYCNKSPKASNMLINIHHCDEGSENMLL